MSADEILDRAARALRQQTDGAASRATQTRARVLAGALQHKKRRSVVAIAMPLAGVLAISSAWASTRGWLPRVWEHAARVVEPQPGERAARTPTSSSAGEAKPVPATAPRVTPEVPTVSIDALPRAATANANANATANATATAIPTATSALPPDDTLSSLYAAAHRAHFIDRDPIAALAAWDAYLRADPDGPLVPEARYNRALSLVRLGRRDEARRALNPFANGFYGTYRTREAREILDAIGNPGTE